MTSEKIEKGLNFASNACKFALIILFGVIIVGLYIFVSTSVTNTKNWLDMIRSVDNACITISSITLAAIIAIMAIIAAKNPDKPIKNTVFYMAIPSIIGSITSLFSLYFSYNPVTFDASKDLLSLSMGFSVISLLILLIIMNFEKDKIIG